MVRRRRCECGTGREEVSLVRRREEGGAGRGGECGEPGTGEVSLGRRQR